MSENRKPPAEWSGQSTRTEHLIAPAGWLTTEGTHLASCQCQCAKIQTCPLCGEPAFPAAIAGRWDAERGYTARPFDPVWVRLSCGCEAGDTSLARPLSTAGVSDE